jgi:coiled-coil domain-containing protein 12
MGNDDRKARLAALAARAGRTKAPPPLNDEKPSSGGGDTNSYDKADDYQEKKSISFRNYAPTDKSLEQHTSSDNENGTKKDHDQPFGKKRPRTDDNQKSALASPPSSKSMLQDALREAQREKNIDAAAMEVSSVANIAPKKINWDLKRDIQPKLAKLEKRTQKAVVDMLKKRLEVEAAQAVGDDDDDSDDLD